MVHIDVTAAEAAMGDITGDLAARRGLVTGTSGGGPGQVVVHGQAPLSELSAYQNRLNAMTAGQGRYTVALSHHEPVSPLMQAQLVAQFGCQDED